MQADRDVVLIDGVRTPFAKSGADLKDVHAADLGSRALTELLAAADLDMQWHTLGANAPLQDVDKFEAQALHNTHLDMPQVPTRYRSSYFLHIWSNGYAAGYYAYLWTEMLDDDAFTWFTENGGLTRKNGQRFRDMILSRGNTEDYNKMFADFRGHEPNIHGLLVKRGLVAK